ncbi:serine protease grass, partial [Drosophila busckii]
RKKFYVCCEDLIQPNTTTINITTNTRRNKTTTTTTTTTTTPSPVLQLLDVEGCGSFGNVPQTINGYQVIVQSRPWMALLKFKTGDGREKFLCGGSLISSRYVLTAAHCINPLYELISVRLGEHTISTDRDCGFSKGRVTCALPVENFEIERVFKHENFSASHGLNDIALIKLKGHAETKSHIRPICLPITKAIQDKSESLREFRVTGWGKTETLASADTLQESIIRKVPRENCCRAFRRPSYNNLSIICAGDTLGDACNGDSGGPLSFLDYVKGKQRFVQYGIVSAGSNNCGRGLPGVYTNVGKFLSWIAEKMVEP